MKKISIAVILGFAVYEICCYLYDIGRITIQARLEAIDICIGYIIGVSVVFLFMVGDRVLNKTPNLTEL